MSSDIEPGKIIIIGAGLAGLALAQGLKHADPRIAFQIFERDSSTSFRAQGYRIRISPDGAAGLQKLLPPHLWDAFEATCAPVPSNLGSRMDARSGEPSKWTGPPPPSSADAMRHAPQFMDGKSYNADRTVLRGILLSGLEDYVAFGKKFEKYQLNPDGTVQVRFADGSSAEGSVLIGADGIRSSLRRQLLPGLRLLDTEGRAIFGKTFMTPDLERELHANLTKEMCLIGDDEENRIKMLCDSIKFSDPKLDASLRSQFKVPADYLYWVIVFRKDYLRRDDEFSVLGLNAEESRKLSLEFTESWSQSVRLILEQQDKESTATLMLHICSADNFVQQWESLERPSEDGSQSNRLVNGPITLLGDAAHPMSPVGGVGANTAFQEASDLCKAMIKAFGHTWTISDAIMAYQGLTMERARAVIGRSQMGAGRFFGMKPVDELTEVTTE